MNAGKESSPSLEPEEIQAITAVARDFIEGWYEADVDRMERSLHPELVKRSLYRDAEDGTLRLHRAANASMMVEWTREGGGSDLWRSFFVGKRVISAGDVSRVKGSYGL